MKNYRSKPKSVKAAYWGGNNYDEIRELVGTKAYCDYYNRCLFVGNFAVNVGEYVVVDGDEVYKMLAELFEQQFEPVE